MRGSLSAHGHPRACCQPTRHRVLAPLHAVLNGKGRRGRGKEKQGKQKCLFKPGKRGQSLPAAPPVRGRDMGKGWWEAGDGGVTSQLLAGRRQLPR